MVELTQREKLLVVLTNTLTNPLMQNVPFDLQLKTFRILQSSYAPGVYSEDELKDLVDSIGEVHKEVHQKAMQMVSKL